MWNYFDKFAETSKLFAVCILSDKPCGCQGTYGRNNNEGPPSSSTEKTTRNRPIDRERPPFCVKLNEHIRVDFENKIECSVDWPIVSHS